MKEREEARVVFDHYTRKLANLKYSKTNMINKGKTIPKKDIERLERVMIIIIVIIIVIIIIIRVLLLLLLLFLLLLLLLLL